ncbi:hypothetical protein AALP_AA5G008400 [Arabis alpina]|uniref:Uncharacterized protein n=1 Tax=Arabis alpina TaxID=50452 RepID=A0A087GU53_ARAAL|nr:hypothetical protein AALP_AA5G008400 [Arabis alpina]
MGSQKSHCLFIETSLKTRLAVLLHEEETVLTFKANLCMEHKLCFPELGEITISAVKVNCGGLAYRMSDSFNLIKAFEHHSKKWFLEVDVVRADEERPTLMAAEDEKKTAITTKDLTKSSTIDLNKDAGSDDILTGPKVKDVEKAELMPSGQEKDLAPTLHSEHGVNESHVVCGQNGVIVQPGDLVSQPITKDGEGSQSAQQVAESSTGLTSNVAKEKKRKREKVDMKQPTGAPSKCLRKKVKKESGSIGGGADSTSESAVPKSGGEKLVEAVQQETEMVGRGDALVLVSESKIDGNENLEHEVAKVNAEIEALEKKKKSSKKKKSRKTESLAQKDALVASAGQDATEVTLVASAEQNANEETQVTSVAM